MNEIKEIKTIVLGVERFMMNRELYPGDYIGILLPKDTDVKRGDIICHPHGNVANVVNAPV